VLCMRDGAHHDNGEEYTAEGYCTGCPGLQSLASENMKTP
jgi:hypothetical protein